LTTVKNRLPMPLAWPALSRTTQASVCNVVSSEIDRRHDREAGQTGDDQAAAAV
jgi:hypothetical protein